MIVSEVFKDFFLNLAKKTLIWEEIFKNLKKPRRLRKKLKDFEKTFNATESIWLSPTPLNRSKISMLWCQLFIQNLSKIRVTDCDIYFKSRLLTKPYILPCLVFFRRRLWVFLKDKLKQLALIAVVPCLGGPLLTKFVVWRQPAGGGGGGDGTAEQEPVVFEIEPSAETTAAVSGQRIEEDTRTVMDILEGVSSVTLKAPWNV